ncbi:MAG: class B sortase [Ruminococcus sp.]|nr:class B sortase [Ruminococcus sp.]
MTRFWKTLNELFVLVLIALSAFIMVIGAWQVYDNYYMFSHTLDKSVLSYKPVPGSVEAAKDSPITEDMIGWLTVDGTNIDYPVMQGADNAEYLSKDPFGRYSATGSIFLDSRSAPDLSDGYSVIYGHHMDYGKMFGALDDFLNETYLREHTSGRFMTGRNAERTYDLEVFASMKVSAKEKTVFDMEQERIRQFIHDNATVLTEEKDLDILALSTCADAGSVTRIVVYCYIVR